MEGRNRGRHPTPGVWIRSVSCRMMEHRRYILITTVGSFGAQRTEPSTYPGGGRVTMAQRSVNIPESVSYTTDSSHSCLCYTGRALGAERLQSVAYVEVDTLSRRISSIFG